MNKAFEEILDKLNQVPNEFRHEEYNEAIRDVVRFIERYKEKYNNGWIPCCERLPEKHQYVLACWKPCFSPCFGEIIRISILALTEQEEWYCEDGIANGRVIAWQPLPEPYKESD